MGSKRVPCVNWCPIWASCGHFGRERDEADELRKWVLFRSSKIGRQRLRCVGVGIFEDVRLIE